MDELDLEEKILWMREKGVKAYSKLPNGGFHLELFEQFPSDPTQSAGEPAETKSPYDDDDLFPMGRARLKRTPIVRTDE